MSGRLQPVVFCWTAMQVVDEDGVISQRHVMVPRPRYAGICARQFHDGEEYPLAPIEARSRASHNAYFAQVHEYFMQMPETIASRWPTQEHLRKWALVETDWCDEKEFTFDNKRYAYSLGTFIRTEDEFARIMISNPAPKIWKVIVRRAKSQSAQAMGRDDFEKSKKDVLDLLAVLSNISTSTMRKEARRHAG